MADSSQNASEGRWYRFDQIEVMSRAFWVRAQTQAEARALVRANPGGLIATGVPDYGGNPDSIEIKGEGRWVRDPDEIDLIEARMEELNRGEF